MLKHYLCGFKQKYNQSCNLNYLQICTLGKGPLSDHSTNSFEGHFVHVGGTDMIVDDKSTTQPKIGRIVSSSFLPPSDTEAEPDKCNIAFYYYNLGITLDIGTIRLVLVYVCDLP